MKKLISFLSLTLIFTALSLGQTDDGYEKTLRKMFKVSGTDASYKTAIDQVFAIYKGEYPEIDEATWKDLKEEFNNAAINDLVILLTPVYKKYISQTDLEGIIKFFETPVGKKYAESTPLITKESMKVGQEWGMKMNQKFRDKMIEKGYK